jgi:hypothetical protein
MATVAARKQRCGHDAGPSEESDHSNEQVRGKTRQPRGHSAQSFRDIDAFGTTKMRGRITEQYLRRSRKL